MKTNNVINILKDNDQDFEWYPTTDKILYKIKKESQEKYKNSWDDKSKEYKLSVLDIGCGDGRAAKYLSCGGKKIIIEKSEIFRKSLSHEFIPAGTDFHLVNLIGLNKVNIIFCNPPYTEYVEWSEKIILQGNSEYIYLVIPCRWKFNDKINNALKLRNVNYKNIGTFSFLNADRKARAEIDIIEIDLDSKKNYKSIDPFKLWFNSMYPNHNVNSNNSYMTKGDIYKHESEKLKNTIKNELVTGKNYIELLVELYNKELLDYKKTFDVLNNLPHHIIKILDISQEKLCNILKEEMISSKRKYWLEFFNRYEPITSKLTSFGKRILLNELNDNVGIDFTIDNIYAVTIWAIKQANNLYNEQIVDLMNKLLTYANTEYYKSNKKTFDEENWRWNKSKLFKYYLNLDLRIILENAGKIKQSNGNHYIDYSYTNNLHEDSHIFLNDILIIAKNLGFTLKNQSSYDKGDWFIGKKKFFYFNNDEIFLEAKAYSNDNFHLKFNTKFLKAFNIEFGRIKKWIKNKKDIENEMNISKKDADIYFNNNYQLGHDTILQICE